MRVLVTGANRGIGLELVRQLKARGDDVIGTTRDPARADALRDTGVEVLPLDVGDDASARALGETLRGRALDLLVNNAGRGGSGPGIDALDFQAMRDMFEINSIGPMRVTQALLPNLRAGSGRRIVHITSELGSISDNRSGGYYAYRASKTALNMLNRSLALELGREGFVTVVVHPGWVQTDMGGPQAPMPVDRSVASMVELFGRLEPSMNGHFLRYNGAEIPW